MIIFALVLAVAAAAPQRPNRPVGLFGQPGAVARPPVFANPNGKPPILVFKIFIVSHVL